ncbi:MAG: acyl-CoA thioesterase [Pirellulaceae bacterium]
MKQVYHHPIEVLAEHIDMQGHVNNLVYLRWMQDAAVAHSLDRGWGRAQYEEMGCGWVVRSHQITYLHPAFESESLEVVTWIDSFRRASCLRKYEIQRPSDKKILATAETSWAFLDLTRRLPTRVPREILEAFLPVDDVNLSAAGGTS